LASAITFLYHLIPVDVVRNSLYSLTLPLSLMLTPKTRLFPIVNQYLLY